MYSYEFLNIVKFKKNSQITKLNSGKICSSRVYSVGISAKIICKYLYTCTYILSISPILNIYGLKIFRNPVYYTSNQLTCGSNYVALSAYEVPVVIVVTDTHRQTENRWHIQTDNKTTHTHTRYCHYCT